VKRDVVLRFLQAEVSDLECSSLLGVFFGFLQESCSGRGGDLARDTTWDERRSGHA
jgi:hypothetical protein